MIGILIWLCDLLWRMFTGASFVLDGTALATFTVAETMIDGCCTCLYCIYNEGRKAKC